MSRNSEQNQRRKHYVDQLASGMLSSAETVPKEVDFPCNEEYVSITEFFTEIIEMVLGCTEERLRSLYREVQTINVNDEETLVNLKNYFLYMESHHTQKYKNRNPKGTTVEYVQATQGEPSGWTDKYLHQEVLTKIHLDFLDGVNLDGSSIMDQLISDQLMTEDERQSIIQEGTPKRRKEAFLYLMKGKFSSTTLVNNFIPAIEADHPTVAVKMKTVAQEIQACPPIRTVCAVCNMKQTVQVKHFVDHLQTRGIISADKYEEFRSARTNNAVKWSVLLSSVPNRKFITNAVKSKFPEIYNSLRNENATDLECKCPVMSCTVESDIANLDDLQSMLSSTGEGHDAESIESVPVTHKAVLCPQHPLAQRSTPCKAIQLGGSLTLEMDPLNQEDLLDRHREKIVLRLSAVNAATAQLVTLGRDDVSGYKTMCGAIYKITSNLRQFICDLEEFAKLQERSAASIKTSARRLVDAFADIQRAMRPGNPKLRGELLSTVVSIGEATQHIMGEILQKDATERDFWDTVPFLTKAVVTASSPVVQIVKNIVLKTEDQEQQNKLLISSKCFVFATLELAACTKVVTPSIGNPACQEQLSQAVKPVAKSVQQVVITAQSVCDNRQFLKDLATAALAVNGTLLDFLQHTEKAYLQKGCRGLCEVQ